MLLAQLTSREVSEWDAYFRWLDEPAPRAPARASPTAGPPAAGDDPAVSWQRLLSFADRVRTGRS